MYLIQGVQARGSVRTRVCCRGENPRPRLYPQALKGGGAFHRTVKQKRRNLRSAESSPQMVEIAHFDICRNSQWWGRGNEWAVIDSAITQTHLVKNINKQCGGWSWPAPAEWKQCDGRKGPAQLVAPPPIPGTGPLLPGRLLQLPWQQGFHRNLSQKNGGTLNQPGEQIEQIVTPATSFGVYSSNQQESRRKQHTNVRW